MSPRSRAPAAGAGPGAGAAPGSPAESGKAAALRTARWLAVAVFLVYVATGGGRIVGSDEVTMLEVSRAMLRGEVAVTEGATLRGPDGRFYSKNAAGQAVLALPLVVVADGAARASGLDPARRELALRFVVSFFNAAVSAVLVAVFYAGARRIGAGAGGALGAALMLAFATPLWVYSKSFMAEPLQALGLLLAALGASLATGTRSGRGPEWLAAAGVLLAVSVKLSMLPLAVATLAPLLAGSWRRIAVPALGLAVALLGHGSYNLARFGTPLETGYGAQATPAAYTTPLLVGLYGLLLSSGKGVMWFAPPLWLAPPGFRAMLERARRAGGRLAPLGLEDPAGRAVWSALCAWFVGLALYARFQHWAGDGSFGPRYLIPLLPLAFLAVAFALERAGRTLRAVAGVLALIGAAVQIGGVSVYFGAQMREAGDYPYTRALDDPRFLSESRWNPRFTPIAGHWRMLIRNAREHAAGDAPRLEAGGAGANDTAAVGRLGVSAAQQQRLLHALDYWWLYLGYAGLPLVPVWGALVLVLALALFAAVRAARAWRSERKTT